MALCSHEAPRLQARPLSTSGLLSGKAAPLRRYFTFPTSSRHAYVHIIPTSIPALWRIIVIFFAVSETDLLPASAGLRSSKCRHCRCMKVKNTDKHDHSEMASHYPALRQFTLHLPRICTHNRLDKKPLTTSPPPRLAAGAASSRASLN